eukprot:5259583-Pleurochrysis_carterae.AAC.2
MSENKHMPTGRENMEIQRARSYLLRAGDEEETQLRSPATAAFASSLSKYLDALRKAFKRTHSPEKVRKLRKERTATAKMLAHTDWDSKEVIREIETATLAGNPAAPTLRQ